MKVKFDKNKEGCTISFNSWNEYYDKMPIIEEQVELHNLKQQKDNLYDFAQRTLHPEIRRYSSW